MSWFPKLAIPGCSDNRVLARSSGSWDGWPCEWFTLLKGVYCRVRRERFGSVLAEGFYPTVWPIYSDPEKWRCFMSELIAKALGKGRKPGEKYKASEDSVLKLHPTLAEFLTCGSVGGKARETATLNVSRGPEGFTLMLKDRETGQLTFATEATFGEALGALEGLLASGEAVWKVDQFAKRPKRS